MRTGDTKSPWISVKHNEGQGLGLMPWQGGCGETDLTEKTINLGKSELICYLELIIIIKIVLKVQMKLATEKLLNVILLSFVDRRVCLQAYYTFIYLLYCNNLSHVCLSLLLFSYSVISDLWDPMDSWQDPCVHGIFLWRILGGGHFLLHDLPKPETKPTSPALASRMLYH